MEELAHRERQQEEGRTPEARRLDEGPGLLLLQETSLVQLPGAQGQAQHQEQGAGAQDPLQALGNEGGLGAHGATAPRHRPSGLGRLRRSGWSCRPSSDP